VGHKNILPPGAGVPYSYATGYMTSLYHFRHPLPNIFSGGVAVLTAGETGKGKFLLRNRRNLEERELWERFRQAATCYSLL